MSATLSTAETRPRLLTQAQSPVTATGGAAASAAGTEDKGVSPLAEELFAPQGDSSYNSRIDNLLSTQQLCNYVLAPLTRGFRPVKGGLRAGCPPQRICSLMLPFLRVIKVPPRLDRRVSPR